MGSEVFTIREASREDSGMILSFIQELASFENLLEEVTATEEDFQKSLFEKQHAEVLIGEVDGEPIAFALFFQNFSTFLGKANLYLEDLYVRESHRGKGYGQKLLKRLAQIAVERDCERLDWWCLKWNEKAIRFYKKMGAVPMSDWTVYRLQGEKLKEQAENF